ncbi:MAG: hypothetical protein Q4D66_06915 [Bacteroidales bacterium]|nr:hypothetical protein [Bacteroidales bacterium]
MKRYLFSLVLLLASVLSLSAMSYREAREYAYFLTDKMAYELELTPEQYERVYEVNLDYLLSINHRRDILGDYWSFRNMDLRYLLADWQYSRFCMADYFYRPLSWRYGSFVFHIYDRYRVRDYYYYERPTVYRHYRGTHWAQRRRHTPSPYADFVVQGRHGGVNDYYAAPRSYNRGYDYDRRYDAPPRYNSSSRGYTIESGRRGGQGSSSYDYPRGGYEHRRGSFDRSARTYEDRNPSPDVLRRFQDQNTLSRGQNSRSFEGHSGNYRSGSRSGEQVSRSFSPSTPSRSFDSQNNATPAPSAPSRNEQGSTSRSGVVSGRR